MLRKEKGRDSTTRRKCSRCSRGSMIKWSMNSRCRCSRRSRSRTTGWRERRSLMERMLKGRSRLMGRMLKGRSSIIRSRSKSDFITSIYYVDFLIIFICIL